MKRFIAIFLTFLYCCPLAIPAAATSTNSESTSDRAPLNEVIAQLSEQYPNSEITFVDGTINIILNEEDTPVQTTRQSIYAPRGGTWSNFHPPLAYRLDPNLLQPYGIVFLPADLTEALVVSKASDYIEGFIKDKIKEGLGIDEIVELLLSNFGLVWTYAQVYFMAYSIATEVYDILNLYGLNQAYQASSEGKISIQFCTSGGWPTNLYYAWEGNYVYDSPWEDFEPDFTAGDYGGLV